MTSGTIGEASGRAVSGGNGDGHCDHRRRCLRAAGSACALLIVLMPASHGRSAHLLGEVGTVETVAGPEFCDGPARIDRTSTTVRALAVGTSGEIHVDTGGPDRGLIGRIDAAGGARLVRLGAPRTTTPVPVTITTDGGGGAIVASGSSLVHVDDSGAGATALAPHGQSGDAGGEGPAAFAGVLAVAADSQGNVYVADAARNDGFVIKYVNRGSEPVTFFAGTRDQLRVAPGRVETIARGRGPLARPGGTSARRSPVLAPALAVAGDRLYVATYQRQRSDSSPKAAVHLINLGAQAISAHGIEVAAGTMETVAGGAPGGYGGDGGPARRGAFGYLAGIATDESGNLYLADQENHRVRRIDPAGAITTFAGTGPVGRRGGGFNGNGDLATRASLNRPFDVEVGPQGALYVSDQLNGQVRFVDRHGIIRAAPGQGVGWSWTCTGATTSAASPPATPRTDRPVSVATDAAGQLYFTTAGVPQVKVVDSSGVVRTLLGGSGQARACTTPDCRRRSDDGLPAHKARLAGPARLAVGTGGLYVSDAADARVRFVNLGWRGVTVHGVTVAAGSIQTVAGNGTSGSSGDGGRALHAQLAGPESIAVEPAGNLLIADSNNGRVRSVDGQGAISTVLGPLNEETPSRCCKRPVGIALDSAGNLYVSDVFDRRVWFLNRSDQDVVVHGLTATAGSMHVVAGGSSTESANNAGPALEASLHGPRGIAVDHGGNLFIADSAGGIDHSVRMVDASGDMTTVAGTGVLGFNGDGLKGGLTALHTPTDVAVDGCGNLVIADQGNGRVRRLNLVPPCQPGERGQAPQGPAAADERAAESTQEQGGRPWLVVGAVGVGAMIVAASAGRARFRRRRSGPEHHADHERYG